MSRIVCLLLLSTFVCLSCNSDDEQADPQNFYALTVGNSWDYDVSRYNPQTEQYEIVDLSITNTISETATINGETYYVYNATSEGSFDCSLCVERMGNASVRDSLGYLINTEGTILFSNSSTDNYLIWSQAWGDLYGQLIGSDVSVNTPAGDFETYQNDTFAVLANGETSIGKEIHLISENIGTVRKTISPVNQENPLYIMTLKSYSLVEGP